MKSRRNHFFCCVQKWATDFDLPGFILSAAKSRLEPQKSRLQVAVLQLLDSLILSVPLLANGIAYSTRKRFHTLYSISVINGDSNCWWSSAASGTSFCWCREGSAQLGKLSVKAQRDGPYVWDISVWVDGHKHGEMLSEIWVLGRPVWSQELDWWSLWSFQLRIFWFLDPFFPVFKWGCT